MYPLGTWFVSGICVWIPCIKETMMIIIIIIIVVVVVVVTAVDFSPGGSSPYTSTEKTNKNKKYT